MTAIRVDNLSKSYGRFTALANVNLTVAPGERRAVIGPNGAGKSTLFNIIAGQRIPTSGEIYLYGTRTTGLRPDTMWAHGLSRTFQRNQLFKNLTVWENVELACAARYQGGIGFAARRSRVGALEQDIVEALDQVSLAHVYSAQVTNLAYGEQRQLEVALALAGKPKILLLDEPTAGMSPAETEAMLSMLSLLPRDITMLIVEHDMDVVFSLADAITVLNLGEVLADGSRDDIQANEDVGAVYMGRQRGKA
jgi:branched-chain amino acid transport system ATP-binding protein